MGFLFYDENFVTDMIHQTLNDLFYMFPEQIGLKGEALSLHTVSGSSSVEWVEGSLLARQQPLTWYKVRTISELN